MQHVLIALYIVTFIAGFLSVYHIKAKYNITPYPFLKTYLNHIIALNLIVFFLALTRYFALNIVNTIPDDTSLNAWNISDILFLIRKGVEYFSIIVIAYTLLKMLHQMYKIRIGKWLVISFWIILMSTAFAYGLGIAFFIHGNPDWLNTFCDWISGIFIIVVGVFLFSLLGIWKAEQDGRDTAIRSFLLFYLIILSFFLIQNLFTYSYQNFSVVFVLLAINLYPMIWYRANRLRISMNGFELKISGEDMDDIAAEYCISTREREVFEYILQGYSNKDIQHKLFLSHHTVKNHNYNLFKKLGVHNKGELIRKILEFQQNR